MLLLVRERARGTTLPKARAPLPAHRRSNGARFAKAGRS